MQRANQFTHLIYPILAQILQRGKCIVYSRIQHFLHLLIRQQRTFHSLGLSIPKGNQFAEKRGVDGSLLHLQQEIENTMGSIYAVLLKPLEVQLGGGVGGRQHLGKEVDRVGELLVGSDADAKKLQQLNVVVGGSLHQGELLVRDRSGTRVVPGLYTF